MALCSQEEEVQDQLKKVTERQAEFEKIKTKYTDEQQNVIWDKVIENCDRREREREERAATRQAQVHVHVLPKETDAPAYLFDENRRLVRVKVTKRNVEK